MSLQSNQKLKTIILDAAIKKNQNNILKFRLFASITKYINSCLIVHNIYIDNFKTTFDIKLNLYVLNYLKNY